MKFPRLTWPIIVLPILFFGGAAAGILVAWVVFLSPLSWSPILPAPIVPQPSPVPSPQTPETTWPAAVTSTDWHFPIDESVESLEVDWRPTKEISFYDLAKNLPFPGCPPESLEVCLPTPPDKNFANALNGMYPYTLQDQSGEQQIKAYDKGLVKSGKYRGHKVIFLKVIEEGMGAFENTYQMLLSSNGKEARWIFPEVTDGPEDSTFRQIMIRAPHLTFKLQQPKDKLTFLSGNTIENDVSVSALPRAACDSRSCEGYNFVTSTKEGVRLYTGSGDVIFTKGNGSCLYAFIDSGYGYLYSSVLPMSNVTTLGERATGLKDIDWLPEYANTSTYFPFTKGGCGDHACADLLTDDEVGDVGSLVIVGHAKSGAALYAPKYLLSHAQVKTAYDGWMIYNSEGSKPSFEEMVKRYKVPVFFWRDSLGRWVRYILTDVVPAGECGKPVVYLYPEKTEHVAVRLPSFITVTKSEPVYPSRGWDVVAEPNGRLSMADGKKFGSLFWEGTGVSYETPKEGFIVKNGEVDIFLRDKLAKYGLNEQESKEFREFWVPRMSGAAYYRVSFLTSAWSKAAPLLVSPQPQTQIRIFMDWQKLSAPISIPEPKIETPERRGFTLVEWGGTLWK